MRRILQLTTYPTVNPTHGGQIRCTQIAAALRTAGHTVQSIAVLTKEDFPKHGADDIAVNTNSPHWNKSVPQLYDYFSGQVAAFDAETLDCLRKQIVAMAPDVIWLEHPWLYQAAQKAAPVGVKIVYSSHNIEWRLKEATLPKNAVYRSLIEAARDLEVQLVRNAFLTIACTQSDADYFDSVAHDVAGRRRSIVAGNGAEPFVCSAEDVRNWQRYFEKPYVVFVGSGHPPNASGFWHMMQPGLTFLAPWQQIVVIGSVCDILLQHEPKVGYEEVSRSRLHLVGVRSKREMHAMISASNAVLLPIVEGEGSNLKTAEALESGRPIVATTQAFRGYEEALRAPRITIADTPQAFRKAVRLNLDSFSYQSPLIKSQVKRFHWLEQLNALTKALHSH